MTKNRTFERPADVHLETSEPILEMVSRSLSALWKPKDEVLAHSRQLGNYPSALCDLAVYAHPEFAYPIVNLMCVGAPVAED